MRGVKRRLVIAAAIFSSLCVISVLQSGQLSAQESRAFLGVFVVDISATFQARTQYYGGGVVVIRVVPGSPAEKARIKSGDVLVHFPSQGIEDSAQFRASMGASQPGRATVISIWRAGVLMNADVTFANVGAVVDGTAACRPEDAESKMFASAQAGHQRDFDREALDAEHAQNIYDACLALPRSSEFFKYVLRDADARLLQAGARSDDGNDAGALPFAKDARSLYHAVAIDPSASAGLRASAQKKQARVEGALDVLKSAPFDLQLTPLGIAAAPQQRAPQTMMAQTTTPTPDADWNVLTTWTSPGDSTYRILHLRINVHPSHDFVFAGHNFRIRVQSPSSGIETPRGLDRSAPSYQRMDLTSQSNTPVVKADIDPREDLGALGQLRIPGGEARTVVVSFVVHSDADTAKLADTLQYVP